MSGVVMVGEGGGGGAQSLELRPTMAFVPMLEKGRER